MNVVLARHGGEHRPLSDPRSVGHSEHRRARPTIYQGDHQGQIMETLLDIVSLLAGKNAKPIFANVCRDELLFEVDSLAAPGFGESPAALWAGG